jgi:hypothetical protein
LHLVITIDQQVDGLLVLSRGFGMCVQGRRVVPSLNRILRSSLGIRASGQFGIRVAVPDGADTQTRLLGFIGRDPFWSGR